MAKRKPADISTKIVATVHDSGHVAQVKQWVIEGHPTHELMTMIRGQFLDDAPSLLMTALDEIADEAASFDADLARGFVLNAYREMYRRAAASEDYATAITALRAFERAARL